MACTRRRRTLKKLAYIGQEQICCLMQGITTSACYLFPAAPCHLHTCQNPKADLLYQEKKNKSRADCTSRSPRAQDITHSLMVDRGRSFRRSSMLGGPIIRIRKDPDWIGRPTISRLVRSAQLAYMPSR